MYVVYNRTLGDSIGINSSVLFLPFFLCFQLATLLMTCAWRLLSLVDINMVIMILQTTCRMELLLGVIGIQDNYVEYWEH